MTPMMRKLAMIAVAFVAVLALATLACSKGAKAAGQGAPQAAGGSAGRPTPSDIDGLLAPVALYPDALLAQILMSAQDPQNLVKLNDFLKANTALKGTELQDAAVLQGFEPNFVALAIFPQVVSMMVSKLDWTTLVGQMFAADKTAVFASIQKLRGQAQTAGNLKSNQQQQVEVQKTSSGEQVIVIEPTNPQIVYVPQYNPTVVYTQPAPTTVVVQQDSGANAAAAAMIGFTAGIVIGSAVNNNYYYGPYGWHGGAYMYNDAWNDYYDHREDAREDWMDHREDLAEERGDRRENASEQRSDRVENRSENRPESQANRDQARANAQGKAQQRQASGTQAGTQSTQQRTTRSSGSTEARGYSSSGNAAATASADRSGTRSDAFSGYSSGNSERAASARGQSSRSSASRSGGSRGGGSRSGGGRRR
jgi:uncharacterized membrane protein YgcG